MSRSLGVRTIAASLSLLAAFLSATYFILVLAISPGTRPSAVLVYPFFIGGLAYAAWGMGRGSGGEFLRIWTDPTAYLRTGVLVAFQLSVLGATYLTGPVDASLFTLVGDVAATPLVALLLAPSSGAKVRSGWFAAGLVVSLAGGTLTILGGRSLAAIPPFGWMVVPAVPLTVALYVLLTARANERAHPSAVLGQSMLGAGLVCLLITPAIPGGWQGLVPPDPAAWGILAALGLVTLVAAPVLYFAAIDMVGPTLPPVLMTAIPVFTLILSWSVLHLGLPVAAVLGIPVAVVGGILALHGSGSPPRPKITPGGPLAGVGKGGFSTGITNGHSTPP